MQPGRHAIFAASLSAAFCLALAISLPAHAQTESRAAPEKPAVTAGASADAEHDAAVVRVVQAIDFYSHFRYAAMPLFVLPEQPNDPAIDAFLAEIMPASAVEDYTTGLLKQELAGASIKDLDEAANFFRTATGQKYVTSRLYLFLSLSDKASVLVGPLPKVTPADNAAIARFSQSQAGKNFSRRGLMVNGRAEQDWALKRYESVLSMARSRYQAMSDDGISAEAAKLHNGSSSASPVSQIAILVEYIVRGSRRLNRSLDDGTSAIQRIRATPQKDLISNIAIVQIREDLKTLDGLFTKAGESMRRPAQFELDCLDRMAVPSVIRKSFREAFEKPTQKEEKAIRATFAALEFDAALRAELDFAEAHAAEASVGPDGKLVFANPDDQATFNALAEKFELVRIKVHGATAVP